MKRIPLVLAAALMAGAIAASHAKFPAAPPKSDAEKAAEAQKAAAAKTKAADLLNSAQEKAVAYSKNRGASMDTGKKRAVEPKPERNASNGDDGRRGPRHPLGGEPVIEPARCDHWMGIERKRVGERRSGPQHPMRYMGANNNGFSRR
jgi:hypothetical protein